MFDPKSTKFPYPEDTSAHYITIKKNNGLVFDENYPYIDTSKSFRFKQALVRLLLHTIVFPSTHIKMGLHIKGKKNLKKHKELLSLGAVCVSNHVHFWDYIAIMKALGPKRCHVLVWANNVRGESGTLVRLVGGIPIPEDDMNASIVFQNTVIDALKNHQFIQVYAEGSMWEYYAPIRPFKLGAAYFAINANKPILPMAFSYRKPSWIRKHIFKEDAFLTLNIGEPLVMNNYLSREEQQIDLTKDVTRQFVDYPAI